MRWEPLWPCMLSPPRGCNMVSCAAGLSNTSTRHLDRADVAWLPRCTCFQLNSEDSVSPSLPFPLGSIIWPIAIAWLHFLLTCNYSWTCPVCGLLHSQVERWGGRVAIPKEGNDEVFPTLYANHLIKKTVTLGKQSKRWGLVGGFHWAQHLVPMTRLRHVSCMGAGCWWACFNTLLWSINLCRKEEYTDPFSLLIPIQYFSACYLIVDIW